jgi:hypothetical protein
LRAEIIADIGIITEIRNEHALAQESHCFIAKQVGNLGKNSLTTKEKGQGFEIVKVKSIDAAIETLMNDKPNNYEGKFISHRDLKILLEAKNYKI